MFPWRARGQDDSNLCQIRRYKHFGQLVRRVRMCGPWRGGIASCVVLGQLMREDLLDQAIFRPFRRRRCMDTLLLDRLDQVKELLARVDPKLLVEGFAVGSHGVFADAERLGHLGGANWPRRMSSSTSLSRFVRPQSLLIRLQYSVVMSRETTTSRMPSNDGASPADASGSRSDSALALDLPAAAADENPAKASRYVGPKEGRPPDDWDLDSMRSS